MKAMGKVMLEANARLAGRIDGGTLSAIVKRILSGA
jgi:uncharacterized protein YqeY